MTMLKPIEDRLMERILVDGNGCWIWQGCRIRGGYGQVYWNTQAWQAHRLSYHLFVGPLGDNMVLHKCDVKPCVNPEHLYLGDHADNMRDARERGMTTWGPNNCKARLTVEQVQDIRSRYVRRGAGLAGNAAALAEEFGVGREQINRIVRHEAWTRIAK